MNDKERNGLMKQRRIEREKKQQLQSNWNSLREWVEYKYNIIDYEDSAPNFVEDLLDKMNELEKRNENENEK